MFSEGVLGVLGMACIFFTQNSSSRTSRQQIVITDLVEGIANNNDMVDGMFMTT
jgi:hypothetical protein